MLNIIRCFWITIYESFEQRCTPHASIYIICESSQHMKHIATRKLIEFKVLDSL